MLYIVKQNDKECTTKNFPNKPDVTSAKFRSYKDAIKFLHTWEPLTKEFGRIAPGDYVDISDGLDPLGRAKVSRYYQIVIQGNDGQ